MIKNGLAEGMVTRKLCVEVLDLVLTSFQTSFFSAPTVSKVQITDMLLLSTSFFSYPLPRSYRQGGFEKKMFPSTSYSFLFQIKAAAHICIYMLYIYHPSKLFSPQKNTPPSRPSPSYIFGTRIPRSCNFTRNGIHLRQVKGGQGRDIDANFP